MKKSILVFLVIVSLINIDSYGSGRLMPYFKGQSIPFDIVEYTIKAKVVDIVTHLNDRHNTIDSVLLSIENNLGSHIENDIKLVSKDSIWIYPPNGYEESYEYEGYNYPIIQENCSYIISLRNLNNRYDSLFFYPYANFYAILPIENDSVEILCYKRYSIPNTRAFYYIIYRNVEPRKISIKKFERKISRINNRVYKKKQKTKTD